MSFFRLVAMSAQHARDVVTWRYPPPYDCYDMTSADPDALADVAGGFFALLDGSDLVGFRSFGADGRVPGGPYDDLALDTGGGLRPDLVGRGLGLPALIAGLAFGRETFRPEAFRVSVASFNERALQVVQRAGFVRSDRFTTGTGRPFEILVRPER